MKNIALDVKTDKLTSTFFTGERADVEIVNGDTMLLMCKFLKQNYVNNEYEQLNFLDDGGTPQSLRVTVRQDRDPTDPLLTFQDAYNEGQFEPTFEDLSLGQVTWLINFNDTDIDALFVDGAETVGVWLEITYLDNQGDAPTTLLQKQITIRQQLDDGATGTPPPTSPTYLTATEIAALYQTNADVAYWANVIDKDLGTPPPTPTVGDTYIVPAGATGVWAGMDNKIAVATAASWIFYTPTTGWMAYLNDEQLHYVFDVSWGLLPSGGSVHNALSGLQGGAVGEYYHTDAVTNGRIAPITAFGASLIAAANATAAMVTLGAVGGRAAMLTENALPVVGSTPGELAEATWLLNAATMTAPAASKIAGLDAVNFRATGAVADDAAGVFSYNENDYTMDANTGLGPVLQMNQEGVIVVYNATGAQLDNGTVCYAIGAVTVGDNNRPSVTKAGAGSHITAPAELVILTMDIPNASEGLAIETVGKIRGVNTSAFSQGETLYLDPTIPPTGLVTNVRPVFPQYTRSLGGVTKAAADGEIQTRITGRPMDTILDFWDGSIRETIDFRVTSDGAVITGALTDAEGAGALTMIFSDGMTTLDCATPCTIVLTAGSATVPQSNYVYIPKSTKVLTVATGDWPVDVEHIRIAQVEVLTAARTEGDGALRNQNWNDHMKYVNDNGHMLHITERLRQESAKWDSGAEGSVTIGAADEAWVKNTAGIVYQMHRQNMPIIDMTQYVIDAVSTGAKTFTITGDGDLSSVFPDGRQIKVNDSTGNDGLYTIFSTLWSDPDFVITVEEVIADATVDGTIGDNIEIVNDSVTPYKKLTDLALQTLDAAGGALNNTSFSVVVFGVCNKSGEASHLMANFPTGTYSRTDPDTAVEDANNYSVYSIPKAFQGCGFLIARFTFINTGGVWSLYSTQDLRGAIPNTLGGGGGGGGGGVSTFTALTDTPSSYVGQGGKLAVVNSGATALEFTSIPTLDGVVFSAANTKTIASGSITPDQALVIVDTEGAAATDDLDTIATTSYAGTVWLRAASAARVVTLKDGTGNLTLSGADVDLSVDQLIPLVYDAALASWVIVGAAEAGGGGGGSVQTIGTTTIGSLTFNISANNSVMKKVTIPAGGVVTGITGYFNDNGSNVPDLKPVIYKDNAGVPGELIGGIVQYGNSAVNGVYFAAVPRWLTLPVSYYASVETDVWIGFHSNSNIPIIAYEATGNDSRFNGSSWLTDVSSPTAGNDYSMYATVMMLGGGSGGGDHNDLTNIQGGSATERYHQTAAENTASTRDATEAVNGLMGAGLKDGYDAAAAHVTADGSSHGHINQDVKTSATPTFAGATFTGLPTSSATPTTGTELVTKTYADALLAGDKTFDNVTINKQLNLPIHTLTDGVTITPDFEDGNNQTVTLTNNRTMANPTNKADGATYTLIIKQDATGSRTLAWGSDYKFPGSVAPVLQTEVNAIDIFTFVCDGTSLHAGWFPPATTKGDLMVHNGTNVVRVGVGTDDQVLTAAASEASGVKWAAGGGGGVKAHAYLTMSASQTADLASGDPVKFDQRDGTIGFASGTYRVTLLEGVKYELEFAVTPLFSAAAGALDIQVYDVTNAAFISTDICSINRINATTSTSNIPDNIMGKGVITPAGDIDIEFRISGVGSLTQITAFGLSWAMIKEM